MFKKILKNLVYFQAKAALCVEVGLPNDNIVLQWYNVPLNAAHA